MRSSPRVILATGIVCVGLVVAAWLLFRLLLSPNIQYRGRMVSILGITVTAGIGTSVFLFGELLQLGYRVIRFRLKHGSLELRADELETALLAVRNLPASPEQVRKRLGVGEDAADRIVSRLIIADVLEIEDDGKLHRGSARV